METPTLLMATLLGFAIAATQAQTQSSTTTTYVQTSKIVGMKVKDSSGQEIGVVKDVVLDRNTGCMAYTVNWWYANNLLFLWFGSLALGTAYYMIPKVIGRPV